MLTKCSFWSIFGELARAAPLPVTDWRAPWSRSRPQRAARCRSRWPPRARSPESIESLGDKWPALVTGALISGRDPLDVGTVVRDTRSAQRKTDVKHVAPRANRSADPHVRRALRVWRTTRVVLLLDAPVDRQSHAHAPTDASGAAAGRSTARAVSCRAPHAANTRTKKAMRILQGAYRGRSVTRER